MINIKKISTVLGISLVLASCAGRTPNPTPIVRIGDDNLSCNYIQSEISEIEAKIQKLLPDSQKTGKNVALGVTGAFLLVPLFFMDFSDAEKIEIESLQARYNHLARLYNDKACGKKIEVAPK
jgi:hypothetical protein